MGCPEFNQNETVHLPHPYACNKYLTCLSKSVMEQTCPGNLHWNIEKNMCDYPDNAKCVDYENDTTVYYNRISRRSRIQWKFLIKFCHVLKINLISSMFLDFCKVFLEKQNKSIKRCCKVLTTLSVNVFLFYGFFLIFRMFWGFQKNYTFYYFFEK